MRIIKRTLEGYKATYTLWDLIASDYWNYALFRYHSNNRVCCGANKI